MIGIAWGYKLSEEETGLLPIHIYYDLMDRNLLFPLNESSISDWLMAIKLQDAPAPGKVEICIAEYPRVTENILTPLFKHYFPCRDTENPHIYFYNIPD